jgi:RNA polymerase sigma-70 factor (ECF subfamily)
VLLRALEAEAAGKGAHSYATAWLFRIAHNLVVDLYRERTRRQTQDIDAVDGWLPQLVVDDDLLEQAAGAQLAERLERAITRLTDDQATVTRYRAAGYTFDEIAVVMGKRVEAVKALIHRARAHLRKVTDAT